MDNNFIVGVDIGSTNIVVVVANIINDKVNIVGFDSMPSAGIKGREIVDLTLLSETIRNVLSSVESDSEIDIAKVNISINTDKVVSKNEQGRDTVSDSSLVPISQDNIDRALKQAVVASSFNNDDTSYDLIHLIRQDCVVDKSKKIINPLEMPGRVLTVNAHLIYARTDYVGYLETAVRRNKIDIENVIFSGLASAYGVLNKNQKEMGVCLVDFGGSSVDIAIYYNNILYKTKSIPVGGNEIDFEISKAFGCSLETGCKLKTDYGYLGRVKNSDTNNRITVRGIHPTEQGYVEIPRLVSLLNECYKVIFDRVNTEIARTIREHGIKIGAGIVLVGGGSKIENIDNFVAQACKFHTIVPTPLNICGLSEYVNGSQYACAIGLIRYTHAARIENDKNLLKDDKEENGGSLLKRLYRKTTNFLGNNL